MSLGGTVNIGLVSLVASTTSKHACTNNCFWYELCTKLVVICNLWYTQRKCQRLASMLHRKKHNRRKFQSLEPQPRSLSQFSSAVFDGSSLSLESPHVQVPRQLPPSAVCSPLGTFSTSISWMMDVSYGSASAFSFVASSMSS